MGDVIVPKQEKRQIPTQLPDFESPTVNTYSVETSVAEKLDSILGLMEFSSRIKDIGKDGLPPVEKLIDISSYPVANVLDLLLQGKSIKKNIIWATDTYEDLADGRSVKTATRPINTGFVAIYVFT